MKEPGRMLVHQGAGWPVAGADEFGPGAERATPQSPGDKLRQVGQILRRRGRLIVLMLIVLNVISIVAVNSISPRYTAEAALIIGPRQAQVVDVKAVIAGLTGDSEVIESETQMLRSRRIARSVVQQLNLDRNPELNPDLRPPGLVSRAVGQAKASWRTLAALVPPTVPLLGQLFAPSAPSVVVGGPDAAVPGVRPHDLLGNTTDAFLRHLSVTPKGRSRVIAVSFDSGDPIVAAQVANAVVDTYIADQLKAKLDATAHAHRWLVDRVAELREQVITADQKVESYRRRAGIVQGRTGRLLSEQISAVSEQVIQARITRANAEARLAALQAGGGRGFDSLPEVQRSVTMQALRAQESALAAQVAQVSRNYGDQHPRTAAIRAELGAVQGRIRAEAGSVAAGLRDDLRTAQAREAALSESLGNMRQEVEAGDASEIELRALQHEADANRALYDRLLARARETNVESGLQQPDAQVISHAEAPESPSFPNPTILIPMLFVASCIAVVLLVFAIEGLDQGFANLDQVEQVLGVPALGVMPRLKRAGGRISPATYALERPASAFGEAVRSLHTSLMLSSRDHPPKVILIASALPGEGKSSIVLALGRMMASCGKRVVVVDCDFRRPDLHRAFRQPQSPGLLECLAGQASVTDVLRVDTASPAYLVPSGSRTHTSPDLFASDGMRKLIADLSERFDLVLLDSAPVLAVSDTRNLCQLADKTVFVVRWQDTRRFAVMPALRQILDAGGDLAGVLLSMVDLDRYAKHSVTGFYQRQISFYLPE